MDRGKRNSALLKMPYGRGAAFEKSLQILERPRWDRSPTGGFLPVWRWSSRAENWETMRPYLLGAPRGSRSSLFVNQETALAMKKICMSMAESGMFGPHEDGINAQASCENPVALAMKEGGAEAPPRCHPRAAICNSAALRSML
ncbi:MAG: hypothetical protein EOQ56_22830 [Mesorhizobium sp.]|nr:MAG: hypothetical protein EOQ56_22830 [Mesorhizobium sp.]